MILQLLVSGLAMGFCYALIALAMVNIYKSSEVLNFAQGDLAMVSTFFAYTIIKSHGVPFVYAYPMALIFAAALGVVMYQVLLRPAKAPTVLGLIIVTLGAEMILYGAAQWYWGADIVAFPTPLSNKPLFTVAGAPISDVDVVTIGTAAGLALLLAMFFRFSRLGIAMKATSQNPVAAELMGIRVHRIHAATWGISSVIGATAGLLIASTAPLNTNLMWDPLLKGFAAAVLGGMTSLVGCVIGGCILGVLENFVGYYVSTEFNAVVPFLVIIIVLCVRPEGLLGKHRIRKV